jgi:hypothetical protein
MTVFAGHYGSIEFKRVGSNALLSLQIEPADISFSRKRFSLGEPGGRDLAFGTITTGDRVRITTRDARGLPFRFYTNVTNTTYIDNPGASVGPLEFFANVDAMGAIRMYRTFTDAINNPGERYLAVPLNKNQGEEVWDVQVALLPGAFNTLGEVQGFTISTDRETIDTTALGEKFRGFSASAITGNGSVDCLFDLKTVASEEIPLALAELIQKVEVGSKFEGKFYILEPGPPQPPGYESFEGVYYQLNGVLSKSAFTVRADQIAECSFDFITAGEFKLRTGDVPVDLTTEDNVSIGNESTLEELGVLQESD